MRTRAALAALVLALTGACASPSAARDEPGGLRFSNSTRSPATEPVVNYREAHDNARRFAAVWVRQDLDTAAWRAQLAELATADLKAKIQAGGFARPKATALRGDVAPRVSRPDRIEFVVDTDDGVQAIVAVPENAHWRIAGVQPA